jgi:dTDP-4-dehydrorhamnose reductase
VLVLGGTGLLGYRLGQVLAPRFDVFLTTRRAAMPRQAITSNPEVSWLYGFVDFGFQALYDFIFSLQPAVVINCIVAKGLPTNDEQALAALMANSILPHQLSMICSELEIRMIHISTDGVFSGAKGDYCESDMPDAKDFYGKSKAIGEICGAKCLNIRTSIIGRQFVAQDGLVEWLLKQDGKSVSGFESSIFSGLTTESLSRLIASLIENDLAMSGTYHVGAAAISKYELLKLLIESFGLDIDLKREFGPECNRSLNSDLFYLHTGLAKPNWAEMVARLALEPGLQDA